MIRSSPRNSVSTAYAFMELFMWHDTSSESAGTLAHGIYQQTINDSTSSTTKHKFVMLQADEHFENAETKRRIHNMLEVTNLLHTHLYRIPPQTIQPATIEDLTKFHTLEYIERIRELSEGKGGNAGHAPFGHGSFNIAQYAVGACFGCVDEIMNPNNTIKNAYALVRPPGHHAEKDKGLGFCLVANVALTAMYARDKYNLKRIAIVDFDAHHGNGTQQAFYDTSDVLFISIHQDRNYPSNSGLVSEIGEGDGTGYNINIPLPPGSGTGAYEYAFDKVVIPAIESYQPELILVSCGFDASAFDPLARMMLCSSAYVSMTQKLMDVASLVCQDRLCYIHEGGYSTTVVPMCGLKTIETLCGITNEESNVIDPFDEIIKRKAGHELKDTEKQVVDQSSLIVTNYLNK
jgi:acetoin utilization deacetylase AcuC-like enzyme